MGDNKLCFVVMPFSATDSCSEGQWTSIFNGLIKPAVEGAGLGYECRRSSASTGNLIKGIVQDLYTANLVIADLTDKRPNVFYELGVRHTLQHRTVLISQRLDDIPSDLHGYACVEYDWKSDSGQTAFTARIREILAAVESDPDRADNPIADFLTDTSIRLFQFQRDENLRKLRALELELTMLIKFAEHGVKHAEDQGSSVIEVVGSYYLPAVEHLLATEYVSNSHLSIQARLVLRGLGLLSQATSTQKVREFIPMLHTFLKNVRSVIAAVDAGDTVESVSTDEFPFPAG